MTLKVSGQEFQSTLPVRGATGAYPYDALAFAISIHAPREGSDEIRANRESWA